MTITPAALRLRTLWVNPSAQSMIAAAEYRAKTDKVSKIRAWVYEQIAKVATAVWCTSSTGESFVASVLAKSPDQVKVLCIYNVPFRDSGGDSGGGAADVTAYQRWTDAIARAIAAFMGAHPDGVVMVMVEPDGLAMMIDDNYSVVDAAVRIECIRYAVRAYKAAGARVYIDGGDSGWFYGREDEMADALRDAAVLESDGIVTNVSHFRTTATSYAYLETLFGHLGSSTLRGYVDSCRNGAGPKPSRPGHSSKAGWCNPHDVAFGQPSTLKPRVSLYPRLDGIGYIKGPWASDGFMCPTGREGAAPEAGKRYDENVMAMYDRSTKYFERVPEELLA